MKSFTAQHSPKNAQSTPGAAHSASAVGAVARPDSSSGAAKHAASETRFAHVKDIFKKQDTAKSVATEGAQGSTEGAQGSMRAHFKPKEQGWDKQQDDAWKEKLAEYIYGGWKGLQHGIYFISNDPGLGEQVGRWHGHYQVHLSLGHKQGATMWVHKGADLELYS